EKISQALKLPVIIASRARGNALLRWPGLDFAQLDGTGRLQLSAGAPGSRRIPVASVINLDARNGYTVASIDSIEAGALHVRGQIALRSSKQLGGNLHVSAVDTGQALKEMADWFGSSVPADLHITGPTGVEANLEGTLDRPRVNASIQANGLE